MEHQGQSDQPDASSHENQSSRTGQQVTIVALGAFGTNAVKAMTKLPMHPAYNNPELIGAKWRQAILQSQTEEPDPMLEIKGDAAKAAGAIYRLSEVSAPPLRIPLGCVDLARSATKAFSDEIEEWASWSVGLDKDEYLK